ncbi:MAG: M1 family metallopeptidase [Bacteroidia bacterium]|nr:M1 family metallopeptidase [Bacteroidia bacterium]
MKKISIVLALVFACSWLVAQEKPSYNQSKFKQLYEELPTPNVYRNAAGAPGHEYYQNRADYDMDIRLEDSTQRIYGEETITYYNESPDKLDYLWLQLDQNVREKNSDKYTVETGSMEDMTFENITKALRVFDGGFKIDHVKDASGQDLPYTINRTMMRVDLKEPLKPGKSYKFKVKWWYNINDRDKPQGVSNSGGRSGMEYFSEDDNYIYTIAQFYPRMCAYNEVDGWQNKQFLGRGEFTLTFGDYDVRITVPSDHVLGATGELKNAKEILSSAELSRLEEAKNSDKPVMIVTEDEAIAHESEKATSEKTWKFHADNVRDFGFATSRKYMWDAQGVKFGDRTVLAMSYFPKEANPLWGQYSTAAVAHTLRTYSKFTFDYPYPVAISAHINRIGMEYPMICFNGYRPEADGTYSARTKYGLISVVIHEVGHNYFPMIVNSDERQWTWMDEGLNSFLQYLSESEWEENYPSRRGPAYKITSYMKGDKSGIMPIMTNSESVLQFGNNAYGKPATALNILRETILGREAFDHAFKTYSQRWMFKQPMPADLFRSMEDASGTDLDWFWRGWFFTTDNVDISIDDVKWYQINSMNPEVEKPIAAEQDDKARKYIGNIRNKKAFPERLVDKKPELKDFYNNYDPNKVSTYDKLQYNYLMNQFPEELKELLDTDKNFYEIKFTNVGGLVMPIILEFTYEDGSKEVKRIPAEVWVKNNEEITKIFITDKKVVSMELDPYLETADTDVSNNFWPPKSQPSRYQLFDPQGPGMNPMQLERQIKQLQEEGKIPNGADGEK